MSLVINHNLMAMNTSRNLTMAYGALGTSTRRLSSGLRVGVAADDAAGLAVRELMRADIASLNQGIRNANDGISLIQTADGALQTIDDKLIRMKELAEQAATGSYNSVQRGIIDSEYQAMASEITRIANATDFNGVQLLNGALDAAPENVGNPANWVKDYDGQGGVYADVGSFGANAEADRLAAEYGETIVGEFSLGVNEAFASIFEGISVDHASADAFRDTLALATEYGLASNAAIEVAVAAQQAVLDAAQAASNAAVAASTIATAEAAAAAASNAAVALGYGDAEVSRLANAASNAAIADARQQAGAAAAAAGGTNVGELAIADAVIVGVISEYANQVIADQTSLNGKQVEVSGEADGSTLDLNSKGPLVIHFGTGSSAAEDYYAITIGTATASALGVGNTLGQLNDEARAQIDLDTALEISSFDIADTTNTAQTSSYVATFDAAATLIENDVFAIVERAALHGSGAGSHVLTADGFAVQGEAIEIAAGGLDLSLPASAGGQAITSITRAEGLEIAQVAADAVADELTAAAEDGVVTDAEIAAASGAMYTAAFDAAVAAGASDGGANLIGRAASAQLGESMRATRTDATDIALIAATAINTNLTDAAASGRVTTDDIAAAGQAIYDSTYTGSVDVLEEDALYDMGIALVDAANAASSNVGVTVPNTADQAAAASLFAAASSAGTQSVIAVANSVLSTIFDDAQENAGLTPQELKDAQDTIYTAVYDAALEVSNAVSADMARQIALSAVDIATAEFEEVDTASRAIAEDAQGVINAELEEARADATPEAQNIAGANISTQENAQLALDALNEAITSKDLIRASLGSLQNRLTATVENLSIQAENVQASESRISDVDVATEMTEFTRRQITSQAAGAMLSQANSLPRMALQLLG